MTKSFVVAYADGSTNTVAVGEDMDVGTVFEQMFSSCSEEVRAKCSVVDADAEPVAAPVKKKK